MPKLYSYVVARDFGFAPNPFHGFCTLAACKPEIRRTAQVGDWIVGTGSKKHKRDAHVVFAMRVTEKMTFNEYWRDLRFREKRPDLHVSIRNAFGDNIYHRNDATGKWIQANSHHSLEDGTPNCRNIDHDTRVDRVLVSDDFVYWGGHGPDIPISFRREVCKDGPGHKCNFSEDLVAEYVAWLRSLDEAGCRNDPLEWDRKLMGLPWDKRRRIPPFQPHPARAVREAVRGLEEFARSHSLGGMSVRRMIDEGRRY